MLPAPPVAVVQSPGVWKVEGKLVGVETGTPQLQVVEEEFSLHHASALLSVSTRNAPGTPIADAAVTWPCVQVDAHCVADEKVPENAGVGKSAVTSSPLVVDVQAG